MFRINSIKFHNFRNIFDSEVKLAENGFKTDLNGVMVGIYGTNGSSKSSVGYALSLFSKLVCDVTYAFFHDFKNDFGINDNYMSVEYDFDYTDPKLDFNGLNIKFVFSKDNPKDLEENPYISQEIIKIKTKQGRPYSYNVIRGKNYLVNSIEQSEMNKISELFSNQSIVIALNSTSIQKQCSFFLGKDSIINVVKGLNEAKKEPSKQFNYLFSFVIHYIQNTSFIMPDSYGLSITNNLFAIIAGETINTEFLVKGPNGYFNCSKEQLDQVESNIEISNRFMRNIIKDFKVTVEKKEIETDNSGVSNYQIRFLSSKKHGLFPFENESEGVKRLFLISAAIAKVMNESDYILFVDELDEGIFEVLFGDIIKSIESQCMGQFIFTSHNLRPLEVMEYTHFIFATINPNNRFVTLKGIKPKNNLRDVYIRKIMYGDNDMLAAFVDESDILGGLIDA